MNFKELNIISPLLKALDKQSFTKPTKVQEKVIPLAIEGKDILGCAQTGSGKTLAFVLPTLQYLYNKRLERGLIDGKVNRKIEALVLAPTRELAIQIGEEFSPYCTNTNFKHTVIYGGVNQFHQVKAIEKGVDILIATSGRLEDLISQGIIKLSYVKVFTLDEADRMLDMGSLSDIQKITKRIPKKRQTLFFSATMPKAIKDLAGSILNNPENIIVNPGKPTIDSIEQQVYKINRNYKRQLLQQISKRKKLNSIIVFVNKKDECSKVFEFVKSSGVSCDFISKDKTQNGRQNALKALKDGKIKVLVATDIASRGLDINNLSCVINYDIPNDAEIYIHRIGRTARAGKKGLAISFCTNADIDKLSNIEKLIFKKLDIINDDSYKTEIVAKGKSQKTIKINKKNNRRKRYKYKRL